MHDTRYPSLARLLQSKLSLAIPPPPTRTDRLIALSLTLIALGVYLRTLSPSLSFLSIDSNELATLPPILGVVHASYPLYTWLGFLFSHLLPFGDVAHRINLMSAVLGAASIGGLYLISIRLLPSEMLPLIYRRSAAATGALLFAFSRTFWSQAVVAEVYAPNVALIALTLLVILRWDHTRSNWDFFFFALTFGLSLGTHLSNLGFAPGLVLFVALTTVAASRLSTGSASIRPGILAGAGLASLRRARDGYGAARFTDDLTQSLSSRATRIL
jgi:hypothetical protein